MNAIPLPASLDFQGITLSITDHKGRPWLTLNEVARALYGIKGGAETVGPFDEENKKGRAKTGTPLETARSHTLRTFKTHADEFTTDETALIDLSTAGGLQKGRVFSIRGCRLMGMVSRAPMAKPFRKWALDQFDVLDALALPAPESQPSLSGGFTPGQMAALKALVEAQVTSLVARHVLPAPTASVPLPTVSKPTRPRTPQVCQGCAAKAIWENPQNFEDYVLDYGITKQELGVIVFVRKNKKDFPKEWNNSTRPYTGALS